jgi:hypothetical protein
MGGRGQKYASRIASSLYTAEVPLDRRDYNLTYIVVKVGDREKVFRYRFVNIDPTLPQIREAVRQALAAAQQASQYAQQAGQYAQLAGQYAQQAGQYYQQITGAVNYFISQYNGYVYGGGGNVIGGGSGTQNGNVNGGGGGNQQNTANGGGGGVQSFSDCVIIQAMIGDNFASGTSSVYMEIVDSKGNAYPVGQLDGPVWNYVGTGRLVRVAGYIKDGKFYGSIVGECSTQKPPPPKYEYRDNYPDPKSTTTVIRSVTTPRGTDTTTTTTTVRWPPPPTDTPPSPTITTPPSSTTPTATTPYGGGGGGGGGTTTTPPPPQTNTEGLICTQGMSPDGDGNNACANPQYPSQWGGSNQWTYVASGYAVGQNNWQVAGYAQITASSNNPLVAQAAALQAAQQAAQEAAQSGSVTPSSYTTQMTAAQAATILFTNNFNGPPQSYNSGVDPVLAGILFAQDVGYNIDDAYSANVNIQPTTSIPSNQNHIATGAGDTVVSNPNSIQMTISSGGGGSGSGGSGGGGGGGSGSGSNDGYDIILGCMYGTIDCSASGSGGDNPSGSPALPGESYSAPADNSGGGSGGGDSSSENSDTSPIQSATDVAMSGGGGGESPVGIGPHGNYII